MRTPMPALVRGASPSGVREYLRIMIRPFVTHLQTGKGLSDDDDSFEFTLLQRLT